MSERCEPPPEWREVQWHILESDREFWMGPPQPRTWQAPASWDAVNGVWWNNFDLAAASPFDAAASGYRYLAPVTPPATVAALVEALEKVTRYAERNTCTHEETHRGGFLWEICDSCGAKWADDEGGKPEFTEPTEISAARAALALYRGEDGR